MKKPVKTGVADRFVRCEDFADRVEGVELAPEIWAVFAQLETPRTAAELAEQLNFDLQAVDDSLRRLLRRKLIRKHVVNWRDFAATATPFPTLPPFARSNSAQPTTPATPSPAGPVSASPTVSQTLPTASVFPPAATSVSLPLTPAAQEPAPTPAEASQVASAIDTPAPAAPDGDSPDHLLPAATATEDTAGANLTSSEVASSEEPPPLSWNDEDEALLSAPEPQDVDDESGLDTPAPHDPVTAQSETAHTTSTLAATAAPDDEVATEPTQTSPLLRDETSALAQAPIAPAANNEPLPTSIQATLTPQPSPAPTAATPANTAGVTDSSASAFASTVPWPAELGERPLISVRLISPQASKLRKPAISLHIDRSAPPAPPITSWKLRPVLDAIGAKAGGGVAGQLLVYRVFLQIPTDLMQAAGLHSLSLVDDHFTIQHPPLRTALAEAARKYAGIDVDNLLVT